MVQPSSSSLSSTPSRTNSGSSHRSFNNNLRAPLIIPISSSSGGKHTCCASIMTSSSSQSGASAVSRRNVSATNPYKPQGNRGFFLFIGLVLIVGTTGLMIAFNQYYMKNGSSFSALRTTQQKGQQQQEEEERSDFKLPKGIKPLAYERRFTNPNTEPKFCHDPEPDLLEKEGQELPRTKDGYLFIKTFKTGSSTAAGINLRIAQNIANRQRKSFNLCKSRFDHVRPLRVMSPTAERNKKQSYLWTIVREPSKRLVSMFFHFGVTREGFEPNGENLAAYIHNETNFVNDYYLKYLSHKEYWFTDKKDDPVNVINNVLRDFDFIAVTERMDESLVALSMLMNVPLADVMYLPAKVHGASYDDQEPCDLIKPSFVNDGMRQVLESEHFVNLTKWDTVLYHAADKSLDMTIDRLGRRKFERKLELYKQAQQVAADRCLQQTIFPCSNGVFHPPNETHCMWKDSNCNAPCLNEVATELQMWLMD